MTTFGDWEPADSADVAPFDADAVGALLTFFVRRVAADRHRVTLPEIALALLQLAARLERERPT